ncbi:MAG: efflux RND transporter periplasmic adaptor subunit [Verrucomicrobiota bacterium]
MKRSLKFIIGLGALFLGFAVSGLLWITRPEAAKSQDVKTIQVVDILPIERGDQSFQIPSQGIVESVRRTTLSAEVGGRVESVSSRFENGLEVSGGEVLVQLDATDYKAALAQAESNLADAESALATEEARAEQAARDWITQGRGGEAPALVRRVPQLKSAAARVASAKAAVAKAKQDVARTTISAPYDAIIATKMTDQGSFLAPGTPVAEVFATGPYEVRLPVSVDELAFLQHNKRGRPTGKAEIRATAAGVTRRWEATISRSEGEIDRQTRSLYLVATIESPKDPDGIEIRPGLFVEASIPGRSIPDVVVVPFRSFVYLDEKRFHVVIVDADDTLRFREVDVLHREDNLVYIQGDFEDGDRICLTEVPDAVPGLPIEPRLAAPEQIEQIIGIQQTNISQQP